ncbi:MAG: tetratricopeptide repeat protein [Myxococcota bacterium]
MVGDPPSRPTKAIRKRDLTELRIDNLRRELDAETDARSQAAILYEIGILLEHDLNRPAEAALAHARAATLDPLFVPPLIASLRIAERGSNGQPIEAICDAQAVAASSPTLRGSALVDLALHTEDWEGLIREAIRISPATGSASLLLEWLAGKHGNDAARADALRAQAQAATDPALRGALYLDLGLAELDLGHVQEALGALSEACRSIDVRWQARTLSVRVAREHEEWDTFDRQARTLAAELQDADALGPNGTLGLPLDHSSAIAAAAWLLEEAAIRRFDALGDPKGASEVLDEAIQLRPESLRLRLLDLAIAEETGDDARVTVARVWFEENAPEHPGFVAHRTREAVENAGHENTLATLQAVCDANPESRYARSALDVVLGKTGSSTDRVQAWRSRSGATGDHLSAWRAAQLATDQGAPGIDTATLFEQAAGANPSHAAAIAREKFGEAWIQHRYDQLASRCDELMGHDLDDNERATIGFCKYEALKRGVGEASSRAWLQEAIDDPTHERWAPSIARARAALAGDLPLLIRAHEALASTTAGATRVGHLCAVAQAHARKDDWELCEQALERALEESPNDPYALSLMEAVMRESGRPEAAVSLVEKRSSSRPGAPLDELALLLAGASAERSGNLPAARHAYETALKGAPASASAALSLLDIARQQGDRAASIRAYEALSLSELSGESPERFTILHADALRRARREAEAAEAYQAGLASPSTSVAGALGVLTTPARATTDAQRGAAEQALQGHLVGAEPKPQSFADTYNGWRSTASTGDTDAQAWFAWSEMAPNEAVRASTLLHGLRSASLGEHANGDDTFLMAQQAEGIAEHRLQAAVALDESLAPGDDAEFIANALDKRLRHRRTGSTGGEASEKAAFVRALVNAGRGRDAIPLLTEALDARPDDLALWETLRSAARQAEEWSWVALACDRLAQSVEGSLRADLLEEGGVVRLDQLDQAAQAEDLFRAALESDPTREVAFRRLHDILADREDSDALEALVATRLAGGHADDRSELLYERARLLRGVGEREEALSVLDELLADSPQHPGALALAAETFVSMERWEDAVTRLERLTQSNIPPAQRRMAHLGAADFLEHQLGRPAEALEELRAVDALGLAGVVVLNRMGRLSQSEADDSAAAEAYERALGLAPTDHTAARGVAALPDGPSRDRMLRGFEDALFSAIDRGGADVTAWASLRDAARWRGHANRAVAAERVLMLFEPTGTFAGAPGEAPDFGSVDAEALGDHSLDERMQQLVLRGCAGLDKSRHRSRHKASEDARAVAELNALCTRFGAPRGVVRLGDDVAKPQARLNRRGEVDWLLPNAAVKGLEAAFSFTAGRLAWITPRGGSVLLEATRAQATGTLAAVLRAAGCEVTSDLGGIPRVDVKLSRSARRSVGDALGDAATTLSSLQAVARWFQQSADRAGLIACQDIAAALEVILGTEKITPERIAESPRAIELTRFWLHPESPVWGAHG